MAQGPFTYSKNPVAFDRLDREIRQSAIVTALQGISGSSTSFQISFKGDGSISDNDKTLLDTIVAAHSGLPLVENTVSSVQQLAYASKTFIDSSGTLRKLYAANTGIKQVINNGSNTINYVATFNWAKIRAIEVINGLAGDYADFVVKDKAVNPIYGVANAVLAQFSYQMNIAPNYYVRESRFDADLMKDMQLVFTYFTAGTIPRDIGINLIMDEVR